jgi:hypothetical protein
MVAGATVGYAETGITSQASMQMSSTETNRLPLLRFIPSTLLEKQNPVV